MPNRMPSPPTLPLSQRELVLMVASLMALHALSIDAMLPALDAIAHQFGVMSGNERQLVVGVYLLGSGVGCLIPGAFADRYGRRPLLLFSLVANTLLSLAVSFVTSFSVLLVLRTLQGIFNAGLLVVPNAVVRDRYQGDQMARLLSMIGAVFIIVPVIAPSFGQLILLFEGWRWIFRILALMTVCVGLWVTLRLPETLDPANRQEVNVPVIWRNMRSSLSARGSIGYVLAAPLMIGAVFGYINSAQQLVAEHLGAGDRFPLVFGAMTSAMIVTNLVNSRIVERFGARRVSHSGVIAFILVSMAQLYVAIYHDGELLWFMPLLAMNLGLIGFLGSNFSSIALQPFAHIAGSAASMQAFIRLLGASLVGMAIGQSYDGTARPFAASLLMCSATALLLVLYSERGKLFRRLIPPGGERVV